MLIDTTHLTFGEIADRWARENADHPGALDHNQILDRFLQALRDGEFNFATLTVDEAPRDVLADIDPSRPADLVRVGPSRMVVTRDILDRMLFPYSDKLTRELWLEGLRISRDDFGRWCEKKGHEQPTFWPQKNDAPKAQLAPEPPRRGTPKGKTSSFPKPAVPPARKRRGGRKHGPYYGPLKRHLKWRKDERDDLDTASLKELREDARGRLTTDGVKGIPKTRSGLEDAIKAVLSELGVNR